MVNILGLSFDYHDASAAVVLDGGICAAADEERFSREKHDSRYPRLAVEFCLNKAGISAEDLDAVVHYERPLLRFERVLRSSACMMPNSNDYLAGAIFEWAAQEKWNVARRITQHLHIPEEKIHYVNHHASHAAGAYYCSPFQKATVITMDGVGEQETLTVSLGEGNTLRKLYAAHLPESIGLWYSAFTAYLGFEVNEGEYKVMGLAAFGQPRYADTLRKLVRFSPDGLVAFDQSYFQFLCPTDLPYTDKLIDLLGPARPIPDHSLMCNNWGMGNPVPPIEQDCRSVDIAASVQAVTEEMIEYVVTKAVETTGIGDVCLSGGVALNSLANGKLRKRLPGRLFVLPASGDAGGAVGAALLHEYTTTDRVRKPAIQHVYFGTCHTRKSVLKTLHEENVPVERHFESDEERARIVAGLIAEGNVIGWMQGQFEWGPRALGNRSILADPRQADMKTIVNDKIKFREPFRPFAPSVLMEHAQEFFDIPEDCGPSCPENFMLSVCPVHPKKQSLVPAIVHNDGTARVHLVRRETNPGYYLLIWEFAQQTGCPMILNTSFNLRGESIVNTPRDALAAFCWSDMDYLAIQNILIAKESLYESACGFTD